MLALLFFSLSLLSNLNPLRPPRLCEKIILARGSLMSLAKPQSPPSPTFRRNPLRPLRLCEKINPRAWIINVSRQAAKSAKSDIP